MNPILCILDDPSTAPAVLAAGRLLSTRLGSAPIRLLHPRAARDPNFMPTEEVMTDDRRQRFAQRQEICFDELAGLVETWRGTAPDDEPLDEIEGDVVEIVGSAARDAALVIAGAATHGYREAATEIIDAVLRLASTPIVVMPVVVPSSIAARPGIAWHRSASLDEASAGIMPVLLAADRVEFLVAVEDAAPDSENEAELQQLMETLRQHGAGIGIHRIELVGRHPGKALAQEARDAGCDLMIMAAHTHSWLREVLFGGVTDDVLAGLDIPVLMHGQRIQGVADQAS